MFSKSREFKDINYDQARPDQTREESNLADLIIELAFLFLQNKTNFLKKSFNIIFDQRWESEKESNNDHDYHDHDHQYNNYYHNHNQ